MYFMSIYLENNHKLSRKVIIFHTHKRQLREPEKVLGETSVFGTNFVSNIKKGTFFTTRMKFNFENPKKNKKKKMELLEKAIT